MLEEKYRFSISAESQYDIYRDVFIYSDTEENAWAEFVRQKGKARWRKKKIKKCTKNLIKKWE